MTKAIILAAGVGSRLRPITDTKPKTLVEVNGVPMAGHIIGALVDAGVRDVVVCVGFMAEKIINYCSSTFPHCKFTFVRNTDYAETNNLYSLYLAREHLEGDVLLMNADLVFGSEVIARLLPLEQSAVAVDVGSYDIESMKVIVEDGLIRGISKTIGPDEAHGCSIDVYRFVPADSATLKAKIEELVETRDVRNEWTEVLLDSLFGAGIIDAKPSSIDGARWAEIDNFADLSRAELLFNDTIDQLAAKRLWLLDRDGTLTLSGQPLPGAERFLAWLRETGKAYFILTNNSSRTPAAHAREFQKIGLDVSTDQVLVSIDSAIEWIKSYGFRRVCWLATTEVAAYLETSSLAYDEADPEALLLTYDTELTYEKLATFVRLVQRGIPYFATHRDVVYPAGDAVLPDAGAFINLIELTTGIAPNLTFGKPNLNMIARPLRDMGLTPVDAVMVGDRLSTDMATGESSDVATILVLTGETTRGIYEQQSLRVDVVTPDLDRLVTRLESAQVR